MTLVLVDLVDRAIHLEDLVGLVIPLADLVVLADRVTHLEVLVDLVIPLAVLVVLAESRAKS